MPQSPFSTDWPQEPKRLLHTRHIIVGFLVIIVFALALYIAEKYPFRGPHELLHVSFDATNKFLDDFDTACRNDIPNPNGLRIMSMHAGSVRQSYGIISGLIADMVSFATPLEVEYIVGKKGYISRDWQDRYPHGSSPFYSTIVFLVAKGNPKSITQWEDLIRNDVRLMASAPDVSGAGRYVYLATLLVEKMDPKYAETEPYSFSEQIYRKCDLLPLGMMQVTNYFIRAMPTDVLVTWESEALMAQEKFPDLVEIVYPPYSILAEPVITLVDTHVEKRNTRKYTDAYISGLFSDSGQKLAANYGFRPRNEEFLTERFQPIKLYSVEDCFGGWDKVQTAHFSARGSWYWVLKVRETQWASEE